MRQGCVGYLANVVCSSSVGSSIEEVPVVREFPDVFPDELPGLPPDRELEFSVKLFPGTAPISKAPYRMAPTELQKLKKQL